MMRPVLGAAKPGPKRAYSQQTFMLYEDEVRVVDHLKGFRKICVILTTHLPAMQDNDTVELNVPGEHMVGAASVLGFKHLRISNGEWRTALAIRFAADESEAIDDAIKEENDG